MIYTRFGSRNGKSYVTPICTFLYYTFVTGVFSDFKFGTAP